MALQNAVHARLINHCRQHNGRWFQSQIDRLAKLRNATDAIIKRCGVSSLTWVAMPIEAQLAEFQTSTGEINE